MGFSVEAPIFKVQHRPMTSNYIVKVLSINNSKSLALGKTRESCKRIPEVLRDPSTYW